MDSVVKNDSVSFRYRELREDELAEASRIFVITVQDLARRNSLPPVPFTVENRLPYYRHVFDTGIFWGAETQGRLVGIANAVVRDRQWFLSGFWVLPEYQGKGAGASLLEKVFEGGGKRGAKDFFTWASVDFSAIQTYLRRGLFPQEQLMTFAGRKDQVASLPKRHSDQDYDESVISGKPAILELGAIDQKIRGVQRPEDHAFFLTRGGVCVSVCFQGAQVGYYYSNQGVIGPAAWVDPQHGEALVNLAVQRASMQAEELRLVIPASNIPALRFAADAKFKLVGMGHFMANSHPVRLATYLPSGPLLF